MKALSRNGLCCLHPLESPGPFRKQESLFVGPSIHQNARHIARRKPAAGSGPSGTSDFLRAAHIFLHSGCRPSTYDRYKFDRSEGGNRVIRLKLYSGCPIRFNSARHINIITINMYLKKCVQFNPNLSRKKISAKSLLLNQPPPPNSQTAAPGHHYPSL